MILLMCSSKTQLCYSIAGGWPPLTRGSDGKGAGGHLPGAGNVLFLNLCTGAIDVHTSKSSKDTTFDVCHPSTKG